MDLGREEVRWSGRAWERGEAGWVREGLGEGKLKSDYIVLKSI